MFLFCSNASGDKMLKPLLINISLMPRALRDSVEERNLTVVEAWRKFTIMDLKACWKKNVPVCVKSGSFVVQKSAVCSEIIPLSNAIGGEGFNMQTTDIDELMRESPLDEDDLIEFMTVYDNKEVDNDEVEGAVQLLTADLIRENLKFATNMEHFLTHDPDMECALKFQGNLKFCVAGYQELFKQFEKPKKQLLITDFITTKKTNRGR